MVERGLIFTQSNVHDGKGGRGNPARFGGGMQFVQQASRLPDKSGTGQRITQRGHDGWNVAAQRASSLKQCDRFLVTSHQGEYARLGAVYSIEHRVELQHLIVFFQRPHIVALQHLHVPAAFHQDGRERV